MPYSILQQRSKPSSQNKHQEPEYETKTRRSYSYKYRAKTITVILSVSIISMCWRIRKKIGTRDTTEIKHTPVLDPSLSSSSPKQTLASKISQSIFQHSSVPPILSSSSSLKRQSPAYEESLSFFDDIKPKTWTLLKEKVHQIGVNTNGHPKGAYPIHYIGWFQNHYEPNFVCQHAQRFGGKWICDPHRLAKQKSCLVYTIGSNHSYQFEKEVISRIGPHCEIHIFDCIDNVPTNAPHSGLVHHNWTISNNSGGGSCLTRRNLKDTMSLLGHEGRTIDIFKNNCQGCEWDAVSSWFEGNAMLRQVLLNIDVSRFTKAGGFEMFQRIIGNGYVIFHKDTLLRNWPLGDGAAMEYAFLKLSKTFFEGGKFTF